MSKISTATLDEEIEDFNNDELSEDDYGFILGPNGELKSIFVPENAPFKSPKNVTKILKMFGIYDIDDLTKEEPLH